MTIVKGDRVEISKSEYLALLNAFNVLSQIECCVEDVLCELQYNPIIDVIMVDGDIQYVKEGE